MIALSLAAALAAGAGLARVAAKDTGLGRGFWLCAAPLLGLASSGALFAGQLLFFAAAGPWSDLLLLALGLALLGLSRGARLPPLELRAPRALWLLTGAAALLLLYIALEHGLRYPDGGWDATAIWNIRARTLFRAPGDRALLFAPELTAHPDYPLLWPALIAHGWFALDGSLRPPLAESPWLPAALDALFAALLAGALFSAIASSRGASRGLCALLLLFGAPLFATLATNQYADLPLAALLLVACALAAHGGPRGTTLAGLAAGLAAQTKNEGLVLFAALALALLAARGARPVARYLLGGALPLFALAAFKRLWAPPNDLLEHATARGLLERALSLDRLRLVASGLLGQLANFPSFGISLAIALLLALAAFPRRSQDAAARTARWMLAPALLFVLGVYLVTPQDPGWHLRSSADRLLFQLWPAALFALALVEPRATAPSPAPAA